MLNKKVLITGADGFIGSHLVEHFLDIGYEVTAFVLYNSFNSRGWLDTISSQKLQNIEVIAGDIRDAGSLRPAIKGCSFILHLAALIAIPYSYISPESYIDTNIKGTLNILQLAREIGVEKVICTSTSEVYGSAKFVPITEDHPLQPQSPYSASKIGADNLALSFYNSFNIPVTILRPFNVYGPRQSARAVIPTIITQIAAGGKEIKLGSLTPTRDYTFVEDTVKAFSSALSEASNGEVINVGSNFEISIQNIFQLICEILQSDAIIKADPDRIRPANSEVERLFADSEKAKKFLKWNPQFAGIEGFKKGLIKTIEWFLFPNNLAKYKPYIYNI